MNSISPSSSSLDGLIPVTIQGDYFGTDSTGLQGMYPILYALGTNDPQLHSVILCVVVPFSIMMVRLYVLSPLAQEVPTWFLFLSERGDLYLLMNNRCSHTMVFLPVIVQKKKC